MPLARRVHEEPQLRSAVCATPSIRAVVLTDCENGRPARKKSIYSMSTVFKPLDAKTCA
jgi:hypothetical protein